MAQQYSAGLPCGRPWVPSPELQKKKARDYLKDTAICPISNITNLELNLGSLRNQDLFSRGMELNTMNHHPCWRNCEKRWCKAGLLPVMDKKQNLTITILPAIPLVPGNYYLACLTTETCMS